MDINDYMTPAEAAYRWGIKQEALKERLKPSRNKEKIDNFIKRGLIKRFIKPGGTRSEWIISVDAMELWYGKENEQTSNNG